MARPRPMVRAKATAARTMLVRCDGRMEPPSSPPGLGIGQGEPLASRRARRERRLARPRGARPSSSPANRQSTTSSSQHQDRAEVAHLVSGVGKLRRGLTGTRVERTDSGFVHTGPEALGHVFLRRRLFGHAPETRDTRRPAKVEETLRNRLFLPLAPSPEVVVDSYDSKMPPAHSTHCTPAKRRRS